MKPENRKMDWEKVPTGDFVTGIINEIGYEKEHKWKPFKGKERQPSEAVRLVFLIDGLKHPHGTPWMSFVYSAKATVFKDFIVPLVHGATEYFDFDIDQLKGLKVKMLWVDNGDYQNIKMIMPADGKKVIPILGSTEQPKGGVTTDADEEVPF